MLYFAYGSNLWPPRLAARTPSARAVGRARLPGWSLHFHKRSDVDASGKASVAPSRRQPARECNVWGALYRLSPDELEALDRAEGLGVGYDRHTLEVSMDDGAHRSAFTYVARPEAIDDRLRPFGWYKDFVVAGAEYHRLPPGYVTHLRGVPAEPDPLPERRDTALEILSRGASPGAEFPPSTTAAATPGRRETGR